MPIALSCPRSGRQDSDWHLEMAGGVGSASPFLLIRSCHSEGTILDTDIGISETTFGSRAGRQAPSSGRSHRPALISSTVTRSVVADSAWGRLPPALFSTSPPVMGPAGLL
jgi:hypothetical protein